MGRMLRRFGVVGMGGMLGRLMLGPLGMAGMLGRLRPLRVGRVIGGFALAGVAVVLGRGDQDGQARRGAARHVDVVVARQGVEEVGVSKETVGQRGQRLTRLDRVGETLVAEERLWIAVDLVEKGRGLGVVGLFLQQLLRLDSCLVAFAGLQQFQNVVLAFRGRGVSRRRGRAGGFWVGLGLGRVRTPRDQQGGDASARGLRAARSVYS